MARVLRSCFRRCAPSLIALAVDEVMKSLGEHGGYGKAVVYEKYVWQILSHPTLASQNGAVPQ